MTITQLKLMDERISRKKLKKCSLIETESFKEMIPTSYQYTQESLTPPPITSKERTKLCIIALLIIIFGIIILLSGIFDIMSIWG